MTTRPITVEPMLTLQQAGLLMQQHDVGSLVVKQNDTLLGILTEYDIVRKGVALGLDVSITPVAQLMCRDLITLKPSMDISDALLIMRDADIRHLPVLDDDTMVGFITMKDILRLQPQLFEWISDRYELRELERKLHGGEEEF